MAKTHRKINRRNLKQSIVSESGNRQTITDENLVTKKTKDTSIKERVLILCCGETEQNYFNGIINSHHFKQIPVFVNCLKSDKNEPQNLLVTTLKIALKTKSIKIKGSSELYLEEYKDKIDTEAVNKIIRDSDGFSFDKLWIVFDADDNLGIKQTEFEEIYQKANDFSVQIAYSVRQWEDWMILHFEKCDRSFSQSQCKNSLKKPVFCGNTTDVENCKGIVCAAGYLRENNYHKEYKKGDWRTKDRAKTHQYCYEGLFDKNVNLDAIRLEDEKSVIKKIKQAIFNANWQRYTCNFTKISPSVDSPYTDVDKLVADLIQVKNYFGKNYFENTNIKLSCKENSVKNYIEIKVENKSDEILIFNQINFKDKFTFFDNQNKKIITTYNQKKAQTIQKNESFLISIPLSDFTSNQIPFYVKYKIIQGEDIIILL